MELWRPRLVTDVNIRKNTFYVDPSFAHDVYVKHGYSQKDHRTKERESIYVRRQSGTRLSAVFAIWLTNMERLRGHRSRREFSKQFVFA